MRHHKLWQGMLILVSLIFPVLTVYYAYLHLSNLPLGDMVLYNIHVAIAIQEGRGLFETIRTPVLGTHYIVPTFIVTAFLSFFTKWDIRWETGVNLLVMAINYALLLGLLWRYNRQVIWFALLPVSALFWTTNQDTNLYIGTHNSWHFLFMFFMLGIYALHTNELRWWRVFLAGLCAALSSLSIASGITAWLALTPLLLIRTKNWRFYTMWVIGFSLNVAFIVFEPNTTSSTVAASLTVADVQPDITLFSVITFFMGYLGNPFTFGVKLGLASGVGILGLTLLMSGGFILWRQTRIPEQLYERQFLITWWAIMLFSLFTGALITVGRVAWGAERVLQNHYITPVLYFWIPLYILMTRMSLMMANRKPMYTRVIARAAIIMFVILAPLHILSTMEVWYGNQWYDPERIRELEGCLMDYPVSGETECFEKFTFNPLPVYQAQLDKLYDYKLAIYREDSP